MRPVTVWPRTTIVDGRSDLNEAAITGESSAVDGGIGAPVFAGSINGDGQLKVTVTKDASNSVVAASVIW
ncbi:MAG: hypothetical protein IPP23_15360 [Sphingomonadales bacterium]|nr:hypothetical protein [Sphingomonadales bacterium]